ncbi:endolytic transglycosylase MltG [Shewanella sp. 0m-8]
MKKIIISVFATGFTLLTIAAMAGYWCYQTLLAYGEQPIKATSVQELTIKRGTTFNQFISVLETEQLIDEGWKLKWLVRLKPELAHIRSGLYEVTPNESLNSLMAKIISGKEKSFGVTLLEGQTVKEWLLILEQQARLQQEQDVFNQVLVANDDDSGLPEGKFFPDTYHYRAGSTDQALLNKSYLKMKLELEKAWQGRQQGLPLKSAYELLILASIIEKETGKASERPWIAAVFVNRLRKGMRLQTDPTVIYGMGDRYAGNITRKDLRETTAFNTYRINGLPPTPIAAPSLAAIQAAAHPADVDYFYFVSRNDGSHIFSKTLTEHNRAVNKYQRNR